MNMTHPDIYTRHRTPWPLAVGGLYLTREGLALMEARAEIRETGYDPRSGTPPKDEKAA